jgi:hypothetical protein
MKHFFFPPVQPLTIVVEVIKFKSKAASILLELKYSFTIIHKKLIKMKTNFNTRPLIEKLFSGNRFFILSTLTLWIMLSGIAFGYLERGI